ncbi:hypothetical protein [Paremcibacter congregatus]|uniref:hypothetical protein n=1 Tax=Paremcibacter congregatus TaxID=2043170 RepID=UPI003A8E0F27
MTGFNPHRNMTYLLGTTWVSHPDDFPGVTGDIPCLPLLMRENIDTGCTALLPGQCQTIKKGNVFKRDPEF